DAVAEAIRLIQNPKAKTDERLQFARAMGEVVEPEAVPALLAAAQEPGPDDLRRASLASLSSYDQEDVGAKVAALLPHVAGDVRTAAFTLLASRAKWSLRLLDAVQGGKVKVADVPDDV